jgi:uncharacterized protein
MSSDSLSVDGILPGRVMPVVDVDNQAFFDAAAAGKLVIQRCKETGLYQWYPRAGSIHTMGEVEWVEASGKGSIYSFTIVRKNPADPAFGKLVPYAIAMVELEEGVHMMGNVTGVAMEDIKIGMPVEVYFGKLDEAGTVHMPFWRPAA